MITELAKGIDAVGYVDWTVRDFHSFETERGATYNAYLVRDEKTALIDGVKSPFAENLLRNLREKTPLEKIDYVVCNHLEPDHAGSLPTVMKALPNATLLCNSKCRDELPGYFDISGWKIELVDSNRTVSLGNRSLAFVNIPMVHWPESMVTYCPEEKILFSNDAFGQHLATGVLFDDQWALDEIMAEAKKYYANIVTPYGRQVLKTLEAAATLDLRMIAPSHGLIWRSNIPTILAAYKNWASGRYSAKVLIFFDSMWGSTARMAEEILRGAQSVSDGLDVQLHHVRRTSLTRLATEMTDTAAVAIGSATLNAGMMPQLGGVLTYLKGLKFREKAALSFGSAGWGPGGAEAINRWLEEVKYPILRAPIKARFRPDDAVLTECRDVGKLLAEAALQRAE